jgi:Lrp/AsnC family transcriptional regulator for asnA, asnC and gidA
MGLDVWKVMAKIPKQRKIMARSKGCPENAETGTVSNKRTIDTTDSRIIGLLQKDGRISNIKIARALGISEATVRNRLQKLVDDRIVQIVAVCDPFKIGFGIVGSISINIDPKKVNNVLAALSNLQEVWYIALTTGSTDVDIDFNVKSLDDLRVLVYDKITRIDGVLRTETSVIMDFVKRRYDWGTGFHQKPGVME